MYKVKHLRNSQNAMVATIAWQELPSGEVVVCASRCGKRDQFSREKGRNIALGRLAKAIGTKGEAYGKKSFKELLESPSGNVSVYSGWMEMNEELQKFYTSGSEVEQK